VRRVDPGTREVLEKPDMPPDMGVSGLESDGGDRFFCGGEKSGKVSTVRRPKRGSARGSGSKIRVEFQEQVIEAALAGELPYLDEPGPSAAARSEILGANPGG
jgi:hypothetical protein